MKCDKGPKMSEDEAACSGKLGNEPPKPELDGLVIGEDLAKRLQTGKIDEERNANYDNYWRERLACMDHAHTDRLSLTIEQADDYIQNIQKYLQVTASRAAPINFNKVINCMQSFKDRALACSTDVQDFIGTVDKLQYELVRKKSSEQISKPNKKMTYAEKFQSKY
ncbi:uncharacterized protein [Fopius arisanus]|uniref:At2g40270 protein n=1 Tax=Fopius arisanus TaxID=64838 RepID=A0A0C9Q462_9HYME|nr:PREDICTED: uncharacterized protein LOC105268263 [Fopius arisanus]